ncbi:MAG: hypothetical protein RH917_18395 [Lacipirellulaceae bacterium]
MKQLTYLSLSAVAWLLLIGVAANDVVAGEDNDDSPAASEVDNEKPKRRARPDQADRPDRKEIRARMLEEFDEDGDGELTGEERSKAREAMRERMQERMRGGGKGRGNFNPGDRIERGVRPQRPGERRGPPPEDRDRADGPRRRGGEQAGPAGGRRGDGNRRGGPDPMRAFDHFDEDGDGMLSREEFGRLAERMQQMQQMRGQAQGGRDEFRGPPRGPRFGDRGDFPGPPRGEDRGEFRGPPRDGERGPRREGRRGRPRPESNSQDVDIDKTT